MAAGLHRGHVPFVIRREDSDEARLAGTADLLLVHLESVTICHVELN